MNIAIVTTWFPAGAGYVSKAYQEILEQEHSVFIYARGGQVMKGHPDWDLPNVTWAPKHYNGIKVKHFIKWAKKNQIDLVFFNEQRYWKPVLEAKRAGLCVGAYVDYYKKGTIPAFEIYDFLICNTKRHYSVFDWHKNAHYVPWGTDIDRYKPRLEGIDEAPIFVVSAGWQAKYSGDRRGSLLALKAFQKVEGDCNLVVYSQVGFDECLPEWQQLLKSDNRIELKVGSFDPFPYTEGDVYLYPSRLDGIGLTLPEAVASGLASISTNSGPMNEFVVDNYNGFLVEVEKYLGRPDGYYWAESECNVDFLTKCMQQYVDNPILLEEHKKNARDFAVKNLDWKKNAQNLSDIFEQARQQANRRLDSNLVSLLKTIDRVMAPSDKYRIILAFYTTYLHVMAKQ